MTSQIQAVTFKKKDWDTKQARKWMKDHNLTPIKHVDITDNFYRYRITSPTLYKRYETKVVDHNGKEIHLIIGFTK